MTCVEQRLREVANAIQGLNELIGFVPALEFIVLAERWLLLHLKVANAHDLLLKCNSFVNSSLIDRNYLI